MQPSHLFSQLFNFSRTSQSQHTLYRYGCCLHRSSFSKWPQALPAAPDPESCILPRKPSLDQDLCCAWDSCFSWCWGNAHWRVTTSAECSHTAFSRVTAALKSDALGSKLAVQHHIGLSLALLAWVLETPWLRVTCNLDPRSLEPALGRTRSRAQNCCTNCKHQQPATVQSVSEVLACLLPRNCLSWGHSTPKSQLLGRWTLGRGACHPSVGFPPLTRSFLRRLSYIFLCYLTLPLAINWPTMDPAGTTISDYICVRIVLPEKNV